ncbi:protein Niban 1-like [Narcine bancroftii]|uniref:protein Niban 1-like n=1 Tax=Narcine bancroftii TaxID=1343680 RepID=UPI003832205B
MGASVSSLDENKCNYVRGKTEAELKNFSPHYQRQYPVTFFNHIRREVEQDTEAQPQLLHRKESVKTGKVIHEQTVIQYVEEFKKWKDRYVVIKNDNSIECYENTDAYQKGNSPKCKLLPTGCRVLTSITEYDLLVDKYFPDPSGTSGKDSNQSLLVNHTQYPVYLWHPFQKHRYFCFENEETQQGFSAVLNDCIRHLNYEFANQNSVEAQVFSEAIQFFRQEKGHYGSWELNHGDEVLILSNLVMEELLPSLQSDLWPKLKGKKNEKKKAWFGIVEEVYNLVQTQLSEGLQTLFDECKKSSKEMEGIIRSDMDQIISSKEFTAGKLKATVTEKAEQCCLEDIQPYLASILEELMGLVSSGFSEVRALFENEVNELSTKYQNGSDADKLKEHLGQLMNLPFSAVKMQFCYNKVSPLQDQLQELKNRFKFTNTEWLVQTTQNFMQELMDNAVYTFDKLLSDSLSAKTSKTITSIEKVKQRVLKQYDHDSSTVRKKLFQEALVQITLPTLQKTLAPSYKRELQKFEQYIFADYTKLVQVENIYEEILLHTIIREVVKVVQEAAILKKHNLFEDNFPYTSDSDGNLTDKNEGKTPPDSQPRSPAKTSSESSCAEGLELGEKVISQISAPTSEVLLNDKQSSASHEKSGDEILHSRQNGKMTTHLDINAIPEISSPIEIYQEMENPVELNNAKRNENLPRNECQNRPETEKENEKATSPAPDSLREIHNLLTMAIVPDEEKFENQEALPCKTNDASHVEMHNESNPKEDTHLKDISKTEGKDETSNVEFMEGQHKKIEDVVEGKNGEGNDPNSSSSTTDELVEGQGREDDEWKGLPSTVNELVEGQGKEDNDKGSAGAVDDVVKDQVNENNDNKGLAAGVDKLVDGQGKEEEEDDLPSAAEEAVEIQVKENNDKGSAGAVDKLVDGQGKEEENDGLPSAAEEVVEVQGKENSDNKSLAGAVDKLMEDNECKSLPSAIDSLVEGQEKQQNEYKNLTPMVDLVEGQGKECKESHEDLPTFNKPPQGQDEMATKAEKDVSQKINDYLGNEPSTDSAKFNAISGGGSTLTKVEAQEIGSIHARNNEVPVLHGASEKEPKILNEGEAKEDDKNSEM